MQKGYKLRQLNNNYNTFQQDDATTFGILLELFTLIIEARATWSYFHKCHSKVSLHFGCHGTVFPGCRVGQRTELGSRLYHGHQICHICHRITAALSPVLRVHHHQTWKTINNIISECFGLSPLIPLWPVDSKLSLNNFTAVVGILAFELKWDMSWICLQENFSAFPIHRKLIKLMQWNHSRTECQGTGKNCSLLQHLLFQGYIPCTLPQLLGMNNALHLIGFPYIQVS